MAIVIGQRPFGKCDVVPELFYVVTWCYHVNYLPLIPMGSRIVLGQSGSTYHMAKAPFSIKSYFYAWARVILFITMIITSIVALIAATDRNPLSDFNFPVLLLCAIVSGGLYALVMIYPRKKMPSYERACQLAHIVGLNEKGWAALQVIYGKESLERPAPR